MSIPSTRLLGVRVDLVDLRQTLQIIDRFIATGKTHQIVVVNASKVVQAQKNSPLNDIIDGAALVGADGVPLIWVSKLFGTPIPGRVNGTDLMEKLVERAAKLSYKIYFLGATEEVVRKVVRKYLTRYPDLKIAGYHNGYLNPEEEENIVIKISKSGADILFVGFGTPQKEIFVKKHLHTMNVPVVHGVGGSFDVIAGVTKRAPLWMQRHGLEWFFRLIQEPKRMFKRYLITNTIFVFLVIKAFIFSRVKNQKWPDSKLERILKG